MVMVDEVAESTTVREGTVKVADLCVCVCVCGVRDARLQKPFLDI